MKSIKYTLIALLLSSKALYSDNTNQNIQPVIENELIPYNSLGITSTENDTEDNINLSEQLVLSGKTYFMNTYIDTDINKTKKLINIKILTKEEAFETISQLMVGAPYYKIYEIISHEGRLETYKGHDTNEPCYVTVTNKYTPRPGYPRTFHQVEINIYDAFDIQAALKARNYISNNIPSEGTPLLKNLINQKREGQLIHTPQLPKKENSSEKKTEKKTFGSSKLNFNFLNNN